MGPVIRAALLAGLLAAPAAAAAQTVIDLPGPPLRARVTLDPALAADPGLQGFLRAEAAETVAMWQDLARDRGGPWWLVVTDRATHLSARYASVLRRTEAGTGSAPGMVALEGLTVERGTGRLLRLDAFLAGPEGGRALAAIAEALATRIAEEAHGGKPSAQWRARIRAATRPDLAVLGNFTLESAADPARVDAIAFHFGSGEVAPGPVSIRIPATVFARGLAPAARPVFALP